MNYNRLYADAFRYGLMFGKDIEPGEPVGVSVLDLQDVLLAVKMAYIDMTPRTLKSQSNEKQDLDPKAKEELFCELAKKIVAYIQNGAENFDQWHYETCDFFMKAFARILQKANKHPEDATYGKAQKIVNMTFKYLYCFDDAEIHFRRFVPCHMALDSYTMDWFFSWYAEEVNKGRKNGEKLTKTGTYHLPNWSHLQYEKEKQTDIVPQYIEIQTAIRNHLKDQIPIEAEFLIWYQQRTIGY